MHCRKLNDISELIEMSEGDASILQDVEAEIESLGPIVEQLELAALLNGPMDGCGTILSVHARDGGLDANDWAEMLLGMYVNWASQNGYEVELLDRSDNEEAGLLRQPSPFEVRWLMGTSREKKGCTGWSVSAPTMRKENAKPALLLSMFLRKSTIL